MLLLLLLSIQMMVIIIISIEIPLLMNTSRIQAHICWLRQFLDVRLLIFIKIQLLQRRKMKKWERIFLISNHGLHAISPPESSWHAIRGDNPAVMNTERRLGGDLNDFASRSVWDSFWTELLQIHLSKYVSRECSTLQLWRLR